MADTAQITALRAKIAEAELAYHQLMLGDKATMVGFGTNRQTEWARAKPAELQGYIAQLKGELATLLGEQRRGPIYPMGFPR